MIWDALANKVTSPGNVVFLPYIKEMRNLGVATTTAGRTNTLLLEKRDFLLDGNNIRIYFSKHLRMYFS